VSEADAKWFADHLAEALKEKMLLSVECDTLRQRVEDLTRENLELRQHLDVVIKYASELGSKTRIVRLVDVAQNAVVCKPDPPRNTDNYQWGMYDARKAIVAALRGEEGGDA